MMHIGTGVMCMCTFGLAPSVLNVIKTELSTMPGGNMSDMAPFLNIPPFGMCTTPSNPAVAAATAAALGVPTPAPCIPAIPAPWIPGPTKTMIVKMPSINLMSSLTCAFGGMIKPVVPGQFKVMIQS